MRNPSSASCAGSFATQANARNPRPPANAHPSGEATRTESDGLPGRLLMGKTRSNHDPFDLIQRDLVTGPVVKLGCPRRLVSGNGLGIFDGPAVFQERRDPCGSKRVTA